MRPKVPFEDPVIPFYRGFMKVMKVDKSFEQNLEEIKAELTDGPNYVGMKVSTANITF